MCGSTPYHHPTTNVRNTNIGFALCTLDGDYAANVASCLGLNLRSLHALQKRDDCFNQSITLRRFENVLCMRASR